MPSHRNLPTTYAEALDRLDGRRIVSAGNNTWLRRVPSDTEYVRTPDYHYDGSEPAVEVVYHATVIATFYPDGWVRLNTDGWRTPTTKERLNVIAGSNARIHQAAGVWYIEQPVGGHYGERQPLRFEDGELIFAGREKPEKVGTHCECGAGYGYLGFGRGWGYLCAR